MEHALAIAIVALIVVAATELLAQRVAIPAAIIQTAIGIALAFVPGFPTVHLRPDFVLLIVLPLLVYAAAVALPWEEFRDNLRPISMLAFGLVAATVAATAAVAHAMVPGLPWAAALVLGAIVSPTDPVASTSVASRIGVPQRLVAITEGEGLVNDAVALTIKAIAVGALLGGSVSISAGVLKLVVIVIGEIAYGWAVGWMVAAIRKRIEDSSTEIIISLLTPFAAYLPAEALGGSGVLATVAAGMYIGVQSAELVPAGTRLHLTSVWQVLVYALNGILFLLTGLQFRWIWDGAHITAGQQLLYGVVIAITAIVVRFCWTWPSDRLSRAVAAVIGRRDPAPSSRHLAFVAWSGMRGSISLAAALSLPAAIESRTLIIFVTATVIAATLLVQGTTLPWVIRLLRLDKDAALERENLRKSEAHARVAVAAAALESLQDEKNPVAEQVRKGYEAVVNGRGPARSTKEVDVEAELRHKAIVAERRRVIAMHRKGEITDNVLRRIERDLDLQEMLLRNRLEPPE